jgi:aminoglycoside phosphotransferase family enzyme/predicted kinase
MRKVARLMLLGTAMLPSPLHSDVVATRREMVDDLLDELRVQARARSDRRPVELVETHLSWVLLGPEVYKIKKPVRLPFVDFSGFEERERACRAEVRINRRLAPRTYLGVVPVRRNGNRHSFGAGGPVVEWAVRMRRLDDHDRADVRLEQGTLDGARIDLLAAGLAAFHADSSATPSIARFGAPEMIERNVADNFAALRAAAPGIVSEDVLDEIERWQIGTIRGRSERFERRMIDGAIRDGHGDLRLEHVFFSGEIDHGFEVIDGIEFDERYRYGDVCADIAFLAMDLARLGRVDLAERFVASYARASNDFDLYGVLDFYESYRACVRAKIALLGDSSEARRYLLLAQSAPRRPALGPVLVAVTGKIASGKSTLAERLAEELSAPIVDADRTRKDLLGVPASTHATARAWSGAYEPDFTSKVYAEVLRRARVVLASGRPVILDASFRSREMRAAARALASAQNVPFRLVECVAPIEVCRARLATRMRTRSVSDATPDILDSFAASFEPVSELPDIEHVAVDTSGEGEDPLAQVRRVIATWPSGLVR